LLFAEIQKEYVTGLRKLADDGEIKEAQRLAALGLLPVGDPGVEEDINKRNKDQISSITAKLTQEFKANSEKARKAIKPFNLRKIVQETFNLSDEEFQGLESQLSDLFGLSVDLLSQQSDAAIAQQDRLISKLDERISKQQELVNAEAELAAQGFANNLDAEKAGLDALNEERRKAAERRNEIERNAANRSLAIEAATQASRLTTTAIELFAGQAKFGLPGILFAVSALATVFSLVAKARAQAAQFAQPVELRGGGLFDGPNLLSHEQQSRRGRYHRIEGSNLAIERGEWIIGTEHSKEHGGFLAALNAGEFKGVNIEKSLAMAQALNRRGQAVRLSSDSESVKAMMRKASGFDELKKEMQSVRQGIDEVRAEVRRKPVVIPAGRNQVVTEEGMRKDIRIIEVK